MWLANDSKEMQNYLFISCSTATLNGSTVPEKEEQAAEKEIKESCPREMLT